FFPLPIPIGCVSDAPAPVVEIVSTGADETTELSVVGKFPTAVPFAFTLGAEAGVLVVVADETTDPSSLVNVLAFALALGDGAGEGELDATAGVSSFSGVPPLC